MKRKEKIAILIAASASIVSGIVLIIALSLIPDIPFRLEDEYYGTSEAIEITKDDYESLIKREKSFVVLVDKPGCVTTQTMRGFMSNFPEDMQFKYYHLYWDEAKESSLHEKVKYTPSVALIHNGKVIAFLDADSKEDADRYSDASALKDWIREYIKF
ncbi:hypothetical protein IK110_03460 [Candidatus Saccharibacteria bacterium]|nr:hypothetical protein [Candidatus Saccharibacteria bacterium]